MTIFFYFKKIIYIFKFSRLKELVQSLAPYKSKLERLKHDSVTATVGLEVNPVSWKRKTWKNH